MVQLKTITLALAAFAYATVANARPVSSVSDLEVQQTKPRIIGIDLSGPLGPLKRPTRGRSGTGTKATPGLGPRPRSLSVDEEAFSDLAAEQSPKDIVGSGIGGRHRSSRPQPPSTENTVTPVRPVGRPRSLSADELEELFERSIGGDFEVEELIERGAFGRLGTVLRPLISGHLKASKVFGRDLKVLRA